MSRLPLTLLASLRFGKPSLSHVNGDIALVLILPFPQRSWDTRLAWEKGLGDEGESASYALCALRVSKSSMPGCIPLGSLRAAPLPHPTRGRQCCLRGHPA